MVLDGVFQPHPEQDIGAKMAYLGNILRKQCEQTTTYSATQTGEKSSRKYRQIGQIVRFYGKEAWIMGQFAPKSHQNQGGILEFDSEFPGYSHDFPKRSDPGSPKRALKRFPHDMAVDHAKARVIERRG